MTLACRRVGHVVIKGTVAPPLLAALRSDPANFGAQLLGLNADGSVAETVATAPALRTLVADLCGAVRLDGRAPRLATQPEPLDGGNADVCGLDRAYLNLTGWNDCHVGGSAQNLTRTGGHWCAAMATCGGLRRQRFSFWSSFATASCPCCMSQQTLVVCVLSRFCCGIVNDYQGSLSGSDSARGFLWPSH